MPGQRSSGFHICDILDLNDPKTNQRTELDQTSLSPNGKKFYTFHPSLENLNFIRFISMQLHQKSARKKKIIWIV